MNEANRISSEIRMHGLLKPALEKDLTESMSSEFRILANNPINLIASMEGPQGGGKSYSIIFLGERFQEITGIELDIDNVHFSTTDMFSAVQQIRRRSQQFLDEQVQAFGMGTLAERETLLNVEKVIRKFKMCFWFISPEFVKHHFHYHMLTWEIGSDHPIDLTKPFDTQWKYTKVLLFNRDLLPFGHVITGTPLNKKFLSDYESKKADFIDDLLEGTISNREKYLEEQAISLLDNDEFIKEFKSRDTKRTKRHCASKYLGIGFTQEEKKLVADLVDEWLSS